MSDSEGVALDKWQNLLTHDPLPNLLSAMNQAIIFFASPLLKKKFKSN